MNKSISVILPVMLAACGATQAQGSDLLQLSTDCEQALALSAAPQHVRAGAGAYVVAEKGYKLVKPASNHYVCLVERVSDQSLLPQCFDKVGQKAQLPVHLDSVRKRLAGKSWAQIGNERAKAFKNGTYMAASGPGVVYMASDYNFFVSQDGKRKFKIAPHVMFHAPNMDAADIASTQEQAETNRGMPFITSEGPQGYMISYVERATDSAEVNAKCKGQLPDPADFMKIPAGQG